MPAETRGSLYRTKTGWGIRWPEDGKRRFRSGFENRTDARRWFAENVGPRLARGVPSADVTFEVFVEIFLARHGATVADRTRRTLAQRLAPARDTFGEWTLRELEGAAGDVA